MINFVELYETLSKYHENYLKSLPPKSVHLWCDDLLPDPFEKCIDNARVNKEFDHIEYKIFDKDRNNQPLEVSMFLSEIIDDCGCKDRYWQVTITCKDWIKPEKKNLNDVTFEKLDQILKEIESRNSTKRYRDPIKYYIKNGKQMKCQTHVVNTISPVEKYYRGLALQQSYNSIIEEYKKSKKKKTFFGKIKEDVQAIFNK